MTASTSAGSVSVADAASAQLAGQGLAVTPLGSEAGEAPVKNR
jgi:hypothetical protein